MRINLKKFNFVEECKGNRLNQIVILQDKETKNLMVLKKVPITEIEKQSKEVEIHRKLSDKFVIRLIDYDFLESHVCLLLEHAEYGDLFKHLKKFPKYPERAVLRLYYRIVKSVDYLHANGFVHRDIKPENILITRNFLPKLADFGTSAMVEFISNTFCGTFEYMAPEIYLRKQQTEKVDIWSLGILLYEITHGFSPFKGQTVESVKNKINNQQIAFKENLNPKIKDLILKLIKFDPVERPTAKHILSDPLFNEFRQKCKGKIIDETYFGQNQGTGNSLKDYKISIEQAVDQKSQAVKNIAEKVTNSKGNPIYINKEKDFSNYEDPKHFNKANKFNSNSLKEKKMNVGLKPLDKNKPILLNMRKLGDNLLDLKDLNSSIQFCRGLLPREQALENECPFTCPLIHKNMKISETVQKQKALIDKGQRTAQICPKMFKKDDVYRSSKGITSMHELFMEQEKNEVQKKNQPIVPTLLGGWLSEL